MTYPAAGITKEDDVVFSFLRRQFFTSRQAEAHERNLFLHSVLGVEGLSTPEIASEKETRKETLNVLLLHDKTRTRNVGRNSKHFPTIKVDFLTNNVDLRRKGTMTVSRNATNDFRTESDE